MKELARGLTPGTHFLQIPWFLLQKLRSKSPIFWSSGAANSEQIRRKIRGEAFANKSMKEAWCMEEISRLGKSMRRGFFTYQQ
jgi:hypothetical protein